MKFSLSWLYDVIICFLKIWITFVSAPRVVLLKILLKIHPALPTVPVQVTCSLRACPGVFAILYIVCTSVIIVPPCVCGWMWICLYLVLLCESACVYSKGGPDMTSSRVRIILRVLFCLVHDNMVTPNVSFDLAYRYGVTNTHRQLHTLPNTKHIRTITLSRAWPLAKKGYSYHGPHRAQGLGRGHKEVPSCVFVSVCLCLSGC